MEPLFGVSTPSGFNRLSQEEIGVTPEQLSTLRALGYAEEAWSNERAATVKWLRSVSKARDDRADPEWALALAEAADFIERGEHLEQSTAHRAKVELAAQAQELHMGYDTPEPESCPMCCGPVDADGMTLAASVDTHPEGGDAKQGSVHG